MSPGSLKSPTKGKSKASSPCQVGGTQVSWSDAETDALIDLIATHKASAGEGLNFKNSFWNTVATAFSNPEKGAPKTPKACKEKWKRLRKSYDIVNRICSLSGFEYTLELGANIGIHNEGVWSDYVNKNKDAKPYRNKGWPHYEKMKQFMPSKGKGLNRFSALNINPAQPGTSASTARSSTSASNSESRGSQEGTVEGSGRTIGVPSIAAESTSLGHSISPTVQGVSTQSATNSLFTVINQDIEMSSAQPLAQHTTFPSATSSPFNPPSTVSGSTYMTRTWQSDQSGVPSTPTNFTPPMAPSSFNGSSISSVKPSSSISARMELSRKQKADVDEQSVASSSLSVAPPSSTSSARKRRTGNQEISRVGDQLGGLRDDLNFHFNTFENAITDISARTTSRNARAKPDTVIPLVHPSIHLVQQRLLQIDADKVSQGDIAILFAYFQQDPSFTDGYLQLAEDPDGFAVAWQQWLQQGIESMARRENNAKM